MAADPHNLQRFIEAQNRNQTFDRAYREVVAGRKQTHWIWFVFPQHVSLGRSEMAKWFGIHSAEEAAAYLAHPTLGERLRRIARAVPAPIRPLALIFGEVDALKVVSCVTLFAAAEPDNPYFWDILEEWRALPDLATLRLMDL